jgi:hypothetical protein
MLCEAVWQPKQKSDTNRQEYYDDYTHSTEISGAAVIDDCGNIQIN